MERRKFLGLTGLGSLGLLAASGSSVILSACKKLSNSNMSGTYINIIEGDFLTNLPIPATIGVNGTLNAQSTSASLISGKTTTVFGYQSGSMLGPTILANSGDSISINFQNNLNQATNIHWHGLEIPANMDGYPMDIISAGGSFNYSFQLTQRASLYWYHPHPDGATASQVFKGLAGAIIARDSEETSLNLPNGEFEVPIIIQDRRLLADYSIDYTPSMNEVMSGYMGENLLVNGKISPKLDVKKQSYRLRILNGSNARIYNLALSNNLNFQVIGSDGGLLTSPINTNSLLLAPGERADVIIDFSNTSTGDAIFLINMTFDAGSAQGKQEFKIMKFLCVDSIPISFSVPSSLSVIIPLSQSDSVASRTFDISNNMGMGSGSMKHQINGKSFDAQRIDETVQAETTEIWEFDNSNGQEPHPMHIHGLQFQVLSRLGGRNQIIATENGWKDTVLLLPNEKVKVILKFSSNTGLFLLHCHNLEHEDDGMMLQFKVV